MLGASTVDRVLGVVAAVAGPERMPAVTGPDTPLREGGFWLDSLGLLEVVMGCEAEFGLDFDPATDFSEAALATVGSLAAVIERRRGRP
jgi:acyl carrier protein